MTDNLTSMATWANRKAVGDEHERRVREELERRGWTVSDYGQGILAEAIRRALQRTESGTRWDTDFLAAQGSTVCGIDAKSAMRGEDAHVYTLSRKALRAGLRLWVERDLPVYYVFANLGVATPAEVMQFCRLASVGEAGGYVSFPAGLPRPFDDVFGNPHVAAGPTVAA
jgi:hypothetical protein